MVTFESSPVGSSRRASAGQRGPGHSTTTLSPADENAITHRVGRRTIRRPPGHDFATYTDPSQQGGFVEDMRTVMRNHRQDGRTNFRAIGGHPPARGGLQHGGKSPTSGRRGMRPGSASLPDGHVSGFKGNVIRGSMIGRQAQQHLVYSRAEAGANSDPADNIGPYWAAYANPLKSPQYRPSSRPVSAALMAAVSRKGAPAIPPASPRSDAKVADAAAEIPEPCRPPDERVADDEFSASENQTNTHEDTILVSQSHGADQSEAISSANQDERSSSTSAVLQDEELPTEADLVPAQAQTGSNDIEGQEPGDLQGGGQAKDEDEAQLGDPAEDKRDNVDSKISDDDAEGGEELKAVRDILEESGLQHSAEEGMQQADLGTSQGMGGDCLQKARNPTDKHVSDPSITGLDNARRVVSSEPNTRPGTAQEPMRPTQSARPRPVFSSTNHPGSGKTRHQLGRNLMQTVPSVRTSHGFVTTRRPAWDTTGLALAPHAIAPRRPIPFRTTTVLSNLREGYLAQEPAPLLYHGGRIVHSAKPRPKRHGTASKDLVVSGNSMSCRPSSTTEKHVAREGTAISGKMSQRGSKKKLACYSRRLSSAGLENWTAAGAADFKVVSVAVASPQNQSTEISKPESQISKNAPHLRISLSRSPNSTVTSTTPTPWTPVTPMSQVNGTLAGGLSPVLAAGPPARQISRN